MSDKKKTFEEKIYDNFPDDWKPDYKPLEIDTTTASLAEIIEASQMRDIFKKFLIEEEDKKMFDVFLDELIKKKSPIFEQIREGLGDDKKKLEIIKGLALATGYGKSS